MDCTNCEQSRAIERVIDRLEKVEEKVSILERNTAVNEEQTKMIFKILTEIKESIADINSTIQSIKDAPNKFMWGIISGGVVAIIGVVAALVIK